MSNTYRTNDDAAEDRLYTAQNRLTRHEATCERCNDGFVLDAGRCGRGRDLERARDAAARAASGVR